MKKLLTFFCIVLLFSCKKTTAPPEPIQPDLPVLEATVASAVGTFSVSLSAKITDPGTSSVFEAGFVVDSNSLPTVQKFLIKSDALVESDGSFTLDVSNLSAKTLYYARSYAQNSSGITYGEQVSFSTQDLKVFTGDVFLQQQQEVDAFGADHYHRIDGSLYVTGTVTDLTPLSDLLEVTGRLDIMTTTQLQSLRGLRNIRSVNIIKDLAGIRIVANSVLRNLEGFEGLTKVYGEILISGNPELESLKGLDSLGSIEAGGLVVEHSDKLTDLDGLEKLELVEKTLSIFDNDLLRNISSLRNLSTVSILNISDNQLLPDISGLELITELTGIQLYNNPALSDLTGLSNLEKTGFLQIAGNKLAMLNGLEKLTSIENLTIDNSPDLFELKALSNLADLDNLYLANTGLTDLVALERISALNVLTIQNNGSLRTFEGLENIQRIQQLVVADNPVLNNIHALTNLTQLNGGTFLDNTSLADFCPLKNALSNRLTSISIQGNATSPTRDELLVYCP